MHSTIKASQKSHILYDADLGLQVDDGFFEPEQWHRADAVTGSAGGRGEALFFRAGGGEYALRHYRRGGMAARLSRDAYLYAGLERSRPWREWRLTARLFALGLPVPRPVAARVVRAGLAYGGDLVTERLAGAGSLAEALSAGPLTADQWAAVGACLARFHAAGLDHADLNAHNILLDGDGAVFLIDFDRGRLRPAPGRWARRNLARLHRSLMKLASQRPGFAFDAAAWAALLGGYAGDGAKTTE